ncbi:FAD-dependent oxidoreductase [Mycolicibacterium parafortuitum]|uniref:ferredoxin--NADP(+) reductase n=1 Tax=Mycolicibacterium parafortuitum TaxID=39692 RepID=A0A375YS32_MYCPF|nr:FAD-dependent oxidoreductase [Mycolicibacterium parafortuitum]ORB28962.1 ferredoxin [Mycolicibacterium parafortuitum]SRX83968.1 putative NADPH:adrenodoxin oxidoreductase FprB (adrenodoxin reductase) (AR) (ferredoxin-NADP(+) reductase) [Mycobacterium tuberculosis H37Rv] [Mycolicibacterium parafortuitum]
MPHVITQSCCSDGSCVYACPVNCIHPTPDEPGFATAEMLYIDPVACVDCGACVSACPVGAISPDSKLEPAQLPFVELNASFYPARDGKLPPTSKLAPVPEAPVVHRRPGGPLRVAIVGSGPAAMYAADELLTQDGVRVNVFEKLPTPYGLVRAGVAPDHQATKRVTRLFDRIAARPEFTFYLNTEVGAHLSHGELLEHHHAVLYAVGAPDDRRLDVDGIGLPGTATATEVVAWYNGHPEFAGLPVDLSGERVVIVGNGNVALDVARILTTDPDALARTDIADHALAALRSSAVREVVVAARRGPAASAFTLPELIGLTAACDVVLDPADHDRVQADLAGVDAARDPLTRAKLEVLAKLGSSDAPSTRPRIRLAYQLTPHRVLGDSRAEAVAFTVTGSDERVEIDAGLVLTSIGYHGKPIRGLPFDPGAGVVPNRGGRVVDDEDAPVPGSYVAGWIKRGPTGFIGTNKSCAAETVHNLVADYNDGRLPDPVHGTSALHRFVRARQPDLIDAAGWKAIDDDEVARGCGVRPRDKFTSVTEMVGVATNVPAPPMRQRVFAALRR